ncbi:MAG: GspE/PulE family protein [Planctomycetia bacterium]|nr:GspE/PulE family protein [Planctomycetia bacterium]
MPDFIEILVRNKLLDEKKVAEAKKAARSSNTKLSDAIVKLGFCSVEFVTKAIAKSQGLEYVKLEGIEVPQQVVSLVPESFAREHGVLALSDDDGVLKVVMADPDELETIDKLQFILNRKIKVALAPKETIVTAVNKLYNRGDETARMMQEVSEQAIDFSEESVGPNDEAVDENSAPVIRLVQMIITEAVTARASDIHVEPFEDRVRIRYRIDGVLSERDSIPKRLLGPVLSRLKILAKIDIAERRRCQDGRIKVTVGKKDLDLRVSVMPTNHGQSVVMRLLDKDNIKVGLKQLGMSEEIFRQVNQLIRRPNGIILVTGPTGSGKTTTLYAGLNDLNRPDRKIITAEDPVEYYLPGINQVEVKHSIGLDFARIIRAMLRQAPNVILVGEMRDSETAEMGIQASLTGHLVFSTLHTNDAPSAITRMIDMGVPAYLVASSIIAILAQRLVRKVCEKCKYPYSPPEAVLEQAGLTPEQVSKAQFMKGKGCAHCNRQGYRGRVGIYELRMMTARVRELAFQGTSSQQLRRTAVSQGMHTLFEDGLNKAMRGQTTLEEVFRIAKRAEE